MRINSKNQNFTDWIDAIDRKEFKTADYENKKNEDGMYPDPVGPWIERWQ